ncbi:sigma-70 family RNA polymerase sigma factor [Lentzea flaviverrucosa]|uniref:RNA polymerase sigma factor, sigma-70 family n=1 Tax=Lentzea flaviverrucosa TaxID=200379 RepID=A0A1H9GG26_9PSEU|nr:sigma-70 family RNA polymerase sigma factor [Lentzea flaviverrucosa]RDI34920.1 RNA polymerase sigma factor (sigma-70 family) [Lentzea flaviverrucosa]SEQ49006.1 RNA polymerase sigma factor, sigma-70 family [Lentzea flaviverrucosa]
MTEDPGVATVTAARDGDQRALDDLVSGYLPLVYNIVGHALGGHPDTDDVVQETMLRAVHGLPGLRDPAGFRSWLVVIAMNQIRLRHRDHQRLPITGPVPEDVADPGADFVDLTIMRLQLSGQRREVVTATRWLSEDERELLSLWWLEAAGRLTRAEVATALELTPQHTAVRVQRVKAQLDAARIVVRTLERTPRCPELAHIVAEWDGVASPLWRKRIARHSRDCARCERCGRDLASVEGLLARLPLVPLPAALGFDPATLTGSHVAITQVTSAPATGGKAGLFLKGALVKPIAAAAAAVVAAGIVIAVLPSREEPVARAIPVAESTTSPPSTTSASSVPPSSAPPTTTPTSAKPVPPPAVPVTASVKKGVSTWNFDGVGKALTDVRAGWYYNWAVHPDGVPTPPNVEFVPMIWGTKFTDDATLARAKANGKVLLGFNEPDFPDQANMTPEQALDLWPKLAATGLRLGSPAVAHSGDKAGGWLDRFMTGAAQRGLRVDFIAVHWYGSDFSDAAVGHLKNYLAAVHARYGKPIWLTEYALIDFSGGTARFPTQAQLAAFARGSSAMMEGLPYVERYAWFALPADKPGTGLYTPGGTPNEAGEAYRAAG